MNQEIVVDDDLLCFQDSAPQNTWEAKRTHSRMHIPGRNV